MRGSDDYDVLSTMREIAEAMQKADLNRKRFYFSDNENQDNAICPFTKNVENAAKKPITHKYLKILRQYTMNECVDDAKFYHEKMGGRKTYPAIPKAGDL